MGCQGSSNGSGVALVDAVLNTVALKGIVLVSVADCHDELAVDTPVLLMVALASSCVGGIARLPAEYEKDVDVIHPVMPDSVVGMW